MRIVMLGTRGVPAAYGGFETAIEEIGSRMVEQGHQVTVYCRGAREKVPTYKGMRLVHLPAVSAKSLETLTHTLLSVLHLLFARVVRRERHDVAFVFNAANAPFLPLLRLLRVPVAVHVDGLEWKRAKWGPMGSRYYQAAESLSVRWADSLIADARGIADYYTEKFGADTELLTYGAPILEDERHDRIAELDLDPRGYHLVVARFEPENHVLEIVKGYRSSDAEKPLLVVGSAPYADEYTARVAEAAGDDPRIRLVGGIWDQELLDQLYANAQSYLHGHSVGGTNPSLLRAMGAGAPVIGWDVNFNREVMDQQGWYFSTPHDVATALGKVEADPRAAASVGADLRRHAAKHYDWDDVSRGYLSLAQRLMDGRTLEHVA